jgi:hypothetical protein
MKGFDSAICAAANKDDISYQRLGRFLSRAGGLPPSLSLEQLRRPHGSVPIPPVRPKPKPPKPEPIPDPQDLPRPVFEVVHLLGKHGPLNAAEILKRIGLGDRVNLHKRYLKPAMQARLVELTLPDQPKSKLQQYRLTARGRAFLRAFRRIKTRFSIVFL